MIFTDGNSVSVTNEIVETSGTPDATIDSIGPGDNAIVVVPTATSDSFASKNWRNHDPTGRSSDRSVNVATPFASVAACVFPPRPCGNVSLTELVFEIVVGTLRRETSAAV